jgi:hypothetical protein
MIIALAGCGAGHPTSRPLATVTVTVTASPQVTSTNSPAASEVSAATTNERLFAEGMAASIAAVPGDVVSGALMRAYAEFQHAYTAAWAAVGQPVASGSVTQVSGGFKICSASPSGEICDTFTDWTINHTGQITGTSVDGQPVAGRMATAPDDTSDGLTISGVVAYQLADAENEVAVAFKLTDTSYRPINTSPALLASLSGASVDNNNDELPATLAPGDSLYAAAVFDVTQISGLFCLQPNDGFGEHLPCTTLSKV